MRIVVTDTYFYMTDGSLIHITGEPMDLDAFKSQLADLVKSALASGISTDDVTSAMQDQIDATDAETPAA